MKTAPTEHTHVTAPQQTADTPLFQKKGAEESSYKQKQSVHSVGKQSGSSSFTPVFHKNPSIQTKLTIGQPGDKYEQEADQMSNKVVQKLALSGSQSEKGGTPSVSEVQRKPIFESNEEGPAVQTKCAECKEEEKTPGIQTKSDSGTASATPSLASRLNSTKGSGSPLKESTRSSMEGAFGADFSGVRVHTDSSAVQMNEELGAHAFTHGSDVYFGAGKYDTGSSKGQGLLAHELTHTIQQGGSAAQKSGQPVTPVQPKIQRGWFGDAVDWVSDTASDIGSGIASGASAVGDAISSGVSAVGGALGSAWDTATSFLGNAASWAMDGLKSLGSATLDWLSTAGSHVWAAIEWFGNAAWDGIKWMGSFLWEKLSLLGTNVWSFLSNIPSRLWRLVVDGWEGITGVLSWAWGGLSAAAGHLWDGLAGVFDWLGEGIEGAAGWILSGVQAGYDWALDFISDPSLSKLWNALTGSLSWAWDGLSGFAKWGWDGVVGAAVWAWQGVKGFASWIWDGIVGGLEWCGRLLLHVLDISGFWEKIQIFWGLFSRMRKLKAEERAASLTVHPAGMIPYDLIWVDEGSIIAKIAAKFDGYRAVTTAHILHVAPNEKIDVMVHELTHVAQYEHVGSVYMAEAIHAQVKYGDAAYNYQRTGTLAEQRAAGKKFKDLNRESQAQLVQDYYNCLKNNTVLTDCPDHGPFITDMQNGEF